MSDRIKVCEADELGHGDREIVSVGPSSIGVFNLDGEYYALSNSCCHQYGPICEGKVQKEIEAEFESPGERTTDIFGEDWTVSCPWHGWEYRISTGEHVGDSGTELNSFDTEVKDGIVYVILG